jgi:hypothetical protein
VTQIAWHCDVSLHVNQQHAALPSALGSVGGAPVLRRIFGTKREEVAGGWTRPHSEELHQILLA